MLVLTLHPGESVQAEGQFEIFFEGQDSMQLPKIYLVTAETCSYVVKYLRSVHVASAPAGEKTKIDVLFGGSIRIGESILHLQSRSRERLKCSIEAPREIKFLRPAQHGGSLLAG